MTGQLGEALEAQVKQFNDSQAEYEVKPLRKGSYPETLTAAIAAYRQKNPPHIVQVFEVGTQTMLLSGRRYPVHELMQEQEIKIDWDDFIKPVVGYYMKDGKLYSMPYNSSTPIFYYNKDAFKKAGLDPEKPPKTWKEVEAYAKKLLGRRRGQVRVLHGLAVVDDGGEHARHARSAVRHQEQRLRRRRRRGAPDQPGVRPEAHRPARRLAEGQHLLLRWPAGTADPKFINGDCAMYIQSSALIGGFTRGLKFDWGTGELPHWGAPYKKATSIIGGATLWVMKGKPAAEYRAWPGSSSSSPSPRRRCGGTSTPAISPSRTRR